MSTAGNDSNKQKPAGGKRDEKKTAELSPEDEQLKEDIAMCVERTVGDDPALQKAALQRLVAEIRASTASMTSVPKPLKFLRPHVARLEEYFRNTMPAGENRVCPLFFITPLHFPFPSLHTHPFSHLSPSCVHTYRNCLQTSWRCLR